MDNTDLISKEMDYKLKRDVHSFVRTDISLQDVFDEKAREEVDKSCDLIRVHPRWILERREPHNWEVIGGSLH